MFLLLPVALENNDSFVCVDYVVYPIANSIEVITLAYIALLPNLSKKTSRVYV